MTIYLRHAVHGTKIANMAMEAEYDEPKRRRSRPPAEVVAVE
jgi:hypothetical protein